MTQPDDDLYAGEANAASLCNLRDKHAAEANYVPHGATEPRQAVTLGDVEARLSNEIAYLDQFHRGTDYYWPRCHQVIREAIRDTERITRLMVRREMVGGCARFYGLEELA